MLICSTELNAFKYSYQTLIILIICLLFNINNSVSKVFLCNRNNLYTSLSFQITNNNYLSMIEHFYLSNRWDLTGTTNRDKNKNGPESNSYKSIHHITQRSWTGASPSVAVKCHTQDTHWLGSGLTPLQRCVWRSLQPQPTRQMNTSIWVSVNIYIYIYIYIYVCV